MVRSSVRVKSTFAAALFDYGTHLCTVTVCSFIWRQTANGLECFLKKLQLLDYFFKCLVPSGEKKRHYFFGLFIPSCSTPAPQGRGTSRQEVPFRGGTTAGPSSSEHTTAGVQLSHREEPCPQRPHPAQAPASPEGRDGGRAHVQPVIGVVATPRPSSLQAALDTPLPACDILELLPVRSG